jgi:hypothetical protein
MCDFRNSKSSLISIQPNVIKMNVHSPQSQNHSLCPSATNRDQINDADNEIYGFGRHCYLNKNFQTPNASDCNLSPIQKVRI